ncbi:MAG: hypothetical protein AMXMBFR84_00640 [Candidatus Hydrogenedentota bacterium]
MNKILGLAVLALVITGCDAFDRAPVRAFQYLENTQVKTDIKRTTIGLYSDYAGDWPQYFYFNIAPNFQFRDVNPFTVTFIHHALSLVNNNTVAALGMTDEHAFQARQLRRRAIAFMERFAARPGDPAAGTYGFWPYDPEPDGPVTPVEMLADDLFTNPVLFYGYRIPPNTGFFPENMAIPSDADTTANVLAAKLLSSQIDGGVAPPSIADLRVFTDWRDTGAVTRRLNPFWLPRMSGLYLTWLDYRVPGDPSAANDVDLLVNANVLYVMARLGQPNAPGVDEAVGMINFVVNDGFHLIAFRSLVNYYPRNYCFEYCVSRAFYEGPLPALKPAVDRMADDLVAAAQVNSDGTAFWDQGSPHLNTAFAVLTLLNAGKDTPLIEQGLMYLAQEQKVLAGNWDEGEFFLGEPYYGVTGYWVSEAFTTAMALEAFCRFRLREAGIMP